MHDTKAKARREKTVITGDMKPMIDSLLQAGKLTAISSSKKKSTPAPVKNKTSTDSLLSSLMSGESATAIAAATAEKNAKAEQHSLYKQNKREIHEKNVERENSKPIMRESVRNKNAKDDLSLFNELSTYAKFAENPLEMLRKTLNQ